MVALRSGEYVQGHCFLHTQSPDGKDLYCCLGVLTHLIDPQHTAIVINSTYRVSTINNTRDCRVRWLPQDIMDRMNGAVGLSRPLTEGGTYGDSPNDNYDSLAGSNDAGKTFEEIADIIEEYFMGWER